VKALEVLGLKEDASDTVIKAVADALRKKHHPDHSVDEADRLQRTSMLQSINNAVDVLLKTKAA
jgi:DnaJ-class molecular chaperone